MNGNDHLILLLQQMTVSALHIHGMPESCADTKNNIVFEFLLDLFKNESVLVWDFSFQMLGEHFHFIRRSSRKDYFYARLILSYLV